MTQREGMPNLLTEPMALTKQADERLRQHWEAGAQVRHAEVVEEADAGAAGRLPEPGHRRRQPTDLGCVAVLLVFLYGLWAIFAAARREGDLAKLTHGFDWKGDICGVDAGVQDKPLLFWCAPGSGTAQQGSLLDGICVDRCPTGAETSSWCPGAARSYDRLGRAHGGRQEVVIGTVRNLTQRADYTTTEALGYCFPKQDLAMMGRIMQETHVSTLSRQVFLACQGAIEGWRFLLAVAAACVVLGYAFLAVLWLCFAKLLYGLVVACHAVLLGGCYAAIRAGLDDEQNFFANYFDPPAARSCAWSCAAVAGIAWALLSLFCCYNRNAIGITIDSVRLTCEVIAKIPTMLLQPFLHSLALVGTALLLLYGLAWVLSTGKVVPDDAPLQEGGLQVQGLQRSIQFTGWQWGCIAYWLFGVVWICETLNALGKFAISHAVVILACFNTTEWFPMLHGYAAGLLFHAGTLALGGFAVSCLKIIVVLLSFIVRQASDDSGVQGMVTRVACCCCLSCVACIERVLTMVNDLIYTDVALRAVGYGEAARHVVRIASSNAGTYVAIKGSAEAVRMLGVATIGGVGTFLSYQVLSSTAIHRQLDSVFANSSSMLATSSVLGTTLAAGVVCCFIATAFMTVFYQTTHTLMYCKLLGVAPAGAHDEEAPPPSSRQVRGKA